MEGKAKDRAKSLLYLIWVQLLVMLILRFYSTSIFLAFQDPGISLLCKLSDVYLLFKWQARVIPGKAQSQNLPQHWDLRSRRECRDNFLWVGSSMLDSLQRGALFSFFNSASCITPRELCIAASQPCHWDPPHPPLPAHWLITSIKPLSSQHSEGHLLCLALLCFLMILARMQTS